MIGQRKKTFFELHTLLRAIEADQDDFARVRQLNLMLLKEILRSERSIGRHKSAINTLRLQLRTARGSRKEANQVRRAISRTERYVDGYYQQRYIWKCFGDGLAYTYLDKHAVKHSFYGTDTYDVKPSAGMLRMKKDMGGAAILLGLARMVMAADLPIRLCLRVGCVENSISGGAMRPSDVIATRHGLSVEVGNTDAEGRLVLCDAITWAQANVRPATIIDLATLTGAMVVALGHEMGGMFANDDKLAEQLDAAGKASGDKLWRMPLGEAYDRLIDSPIADIKNVGPREGGSITAAQFIGRFIDEGVKWAHLDIAGMAWSDKPNSTYDKGATGFGVRLLDQYVADVVEKG